MLPCLLFVDEGGSSPRRRAVGRAAPSGAGGDGRGGGGLSRVMHIARARRAATRRAERLRLGGALPAVGRARALHSARTCLWCGVCVWKNIGQNAGQNLTRIHDQELGLCPYDFSRQPKT